jgi:GNAT superfamily N-acetyltransferase
VQLVRPAAGTTAYRGVLSRAKQARATVGFLTDAAFAERAEQGTLLVALVDDEVAGYLLYDLPRDEIRIVHLVVVSTRRGLGLARRLVDRVAEDHAERRGIFLHCRNDFDADTVWPKLDFEPRGERPGRSVDGKPLTRWYRSFGQPDLFTYLHENDTRPIATMDACVFFDLVALRPKPVTQQLRADWLGEHVRLAVAGHLSNEIHRGKDPAERQRQAAAQEQFRLSAQPAAVWRAILKQLLDAYPNAPLRDHDDLIHAAQSIASGATWLITGDGPFARRYGAGVAQLGGLRLVSPPAFLREVDELARGDRYRPIDLAGTEVKRREVSAAALPDLADTFVNHPAGERLRTLRANTELAAARALDVRLEVIEVDGDPRGLVAWQLTADALDVLLLRATTGIGETTIGRHLLGLLRDEATGCGRETIRVLDDRPSATVTRSFRDEGFALGPGGVVVAHVLTGVSTLADVCVHALALGSPLGSPLAEGDLFAEEAIELGQRAAQLERWFSPVCIIGAGIPAFFVPIRHGWATDLVDVGLADDQLLSRPWGLGLRRELVYYRSPRNPASLPSPARLLWYVSGTGPGAGTIRAVSHLVEVAVDDKERLFHRFRSLGVYDARDVDRVADQKTGRVMALRFSSTVRFRRPVPLDDYRELATGDPKSRHVMLQSIHPVSEHVFVALIEIGGLGAT